MADIHHPQSLEAILNAISPIDEHYPMLEATEHQGIQLLLDQQPAIHPCIDHHPLPPSLSKVGPSSPFSQVSPSFLPPIAPEHDLLSMPRRPDLWKVPFPNGPPVTRISIQQAPEVHEALRFLIWAEYSPRSPDRGHCLSQITTWASKITPLITPIRIPDFVPCGSWPCWGTLLLLQEVGIQRFDTVTGKVFYLCMAVESILLPGKRDMISEQVTLLYHPFATLQREGGLQAVVAVWLPREWVPVRMRSVWEARRNMRTGIRHRLTAAEDGDLMDQESERLQEGLTGQYLARVGGMAAIQRARVNDWRNAWDREQERTRSMHSSPIVVE